MVFLNATNVVGTLTEMRGIQIRTQNCQKSTTRALYGMRKGKKIGLLTNIYILRNKGNNHGKEISVNHGAWDGQ